MHTTPAIWFPTIRCGTGTDVFTERLAEGLRGRGIRCEITWLPHRAEYAPWTVPIPKPPPWANVVHINSWLPPRFVPRHLPLVVTVHHSVHDPSLLPYKNLPRRLYHARWIRPIEAENIHRAASVTAVSHYVAAEIERLFGHRQTTVIHNGIDTESTFTPGQPRTRPHHPFRLLYVGNWMARKGVDLLEPILTRLGADFELWYTADRASAHHHYSLPPNSRCLGRLDREGLVKAYREADALLFPTRSEGFGLTAAEAMACGLPVIASKVSSLPEIVEDGMTGYLCPVDDVATFAEAARRLINDPRSWSAMGKAAREKTERFFSLSRIIDAYISIYKNSLLH